MQGHRESEGGLPVRGIRKVTLRFPSNPSVCGFYITENASSPGISHSGSTEDFPMTPERCFQSEYCPEPLCKGSTPSLSLPLLQSMAAQHHDIAEAIRVFYRDLAGHSYRSVKQCCDFILEKGDRTIRAVMVSEGLVRLPLLFGCGRLPLVLHTLPMPCG